MHFSAILSEHILSGSRCGLSSPVIAFLSRCFHWELVIDIHRRRNRGVGETMVGKILAESHLSHWGKAAAIVASQPKGGDRGDPASNAIATTTAFTIRANRVMRSFRRSFLV